MGAGPTPCASRNWCLARPPSEHCLSANAEREFPPGWVGGSEFAWQWGTCSIPTGPPLFRRGAIACTQGSGYVNW
eukprot:11172096-Lingulodinium_polyedra.AAC.1